MARSKTSKTLERVKKARARLDAAEEAFREAMDEARYVGEHSWSEISDVAGIERSVVRYHVLTRAKRREAENAAA